MSAPSDDAADRSQETDVSRRRFLSRTAGGAAALTAAASSLKSRTSRAAVQASAGNVPQTGEMVEFKSGSLTIPAYLSRAKAQNAPAVLVIHEVFGLNDHIKSIADRISREGYNALAPNFFARAAEPPPKDASDMQAIRKAASSISNDDAVKDMQASLDYLKTVKGIKPKFTSIGFCMGGGFSYQLATHSKDLSGAVIFYGRTPIDLVPMVSCPLLGNFGGKDQGIPPEKVKEFEEALQKAGKTADIKVYPEAGHGFFNDTRPQAYNAEAAADAWQRTVKFFQSRLA
jgi:carboxymethylenebutenolidase